MTTARLVLLALSTATALTACGSSSSPDVPPSLSALLSRSGCAVVDTGPQLLTREAADCTLGGASLSVATFASRSNRDAWVTFVKGTSSASVTVRGGDLWAVAGGDASAVSAFVNAVG